MNAVEPITKGFQVYSTSARPISAFRKTPFSPRGHTSNTVENFTSGIVENDSLSPPSWPIDPQNRRRDRTELKAV
jgi:hypothetical protein